MLVMMAAGILLGVFLGVSVAIVLDALSGRIKSINDAELASSAMVLGVLPRLTGNRPSIGE